MSEVPLQDPFEDTDPSNTGLYPQPVLPEPYRGTLLIINTPLLGPCSRTIPRVI